jgi:hypothetical protein
MFFPDDAVRVAALSEYVGRWVALGTTSPHLQPDGDIKRSPMWRNGRRNRLKILWAVTGPCRVQSGHRHQLIAVN